MAEQEVGEELGHPSLTQPLSLHPLAPQLLPVCDYGGSKPCGFPKERPGEGKVGRAASWARTAPRGTKACCPHYAQMVWL